MRKGQFWRNKIISFSDARGHSRPLAAIVGLISFAAVAGAWVTPAHAQGYLTPDTTQSRYEYGDGPVSLYGQGVSDAQAGLQGAVILDFGRPAQDGAGVQSMLDFSSQVDSLGAIANAVERYIDGYRHVAAASAKLTVFIGTNDSCGTGQPCGGSTCGCSKEPTSFAAWGKAWGGAVGVVNAYAVSSAGSSATVTVGGADDAEPGFDPAYTNTFNTLTGYSAETTLPMADYGSLDGGPGSSYWTPAQLAAVAGGFRSDVPFPEIYHQSMADQWASLSNWAAVNLGKPLTIGGILTDEVAAGNVTPVTTPTPIVLPTVPASPSPTITPTATPTATPSVTGSVSPSASVSPSPSSSPSPSPSATPTATDTPQQAVDQLLGDLNTKYTATHQDAIEWSSNINKATATASATAYTRLGGADRESTAVAISQQQYPLSSSAQAVVLARADSYPDALSGGPLAAHLHAPLLLTTPTVLSPATATEITRVLPPGGTIYLLGGTAAISSAVQTSLVALGFATQRVDGPDRYATAVAVADLLGDPTTTLLATGINFPDALVAGDAAVTLDGAVLLTEGTVLPPATSAYLAAHTGGTLYALGGPAAKADPTATPLVGADRDQTAIVAAEKFDPTPTGIGVTTDINFPDAMAAAPLLGGLGYPLLLTPPVGVPTATATFLSSTVTATHIDVLGLQAAVSDATAYQTLYQLG